MKSYGCQVITATTKKSEDELLPLNKLGPFSTAAGEYTHTCINSATKPLLWAGLSDGRHQPLT